MNPPPLMGALIFRGGVHLGPPCEPQQGPDLKCNLEHLNDDVYALLILTFFSSYFRLFFS